ncbi:MAG: carbon-nitrogen hydrolase family protein [Eggerthellaceae bacterium]|jgi:predicted amidohydrolase
MTFKIGLAQTRRPEDGDMLACARHFADQAKKEGVDILVFHEAFMNPYELNVEEFLAAAESLDGPYASAMDSLAKEFGFYLVYCVNEKNAAGDKPYNTTVMTDDSGTQIGVYRKIHLFDAGHYHESAKMTPGDKLSHPITTPFGKIGLGICYDLRFPEFARKAALEGCELLIYPSAWVAGPHKREQWETLLRARAIENEIFVAGVSRADSNYVGSSLVIDPFGRILARGTMGNDLICAEIDFDVVKEARAKIPVFNHRRIDLY